MECAGRGLNFWSYQATQEIVYQEYLAKSLADKYSNLSLQMDKIIHDANAEISLLRDKISTLELDRQHIQRKNHELAEAYRVKNRDHLQARELYDKLKRRTSYSKVQSAALETVDRTLHTSSAIGGSFARKTGEMGISQQVMGETQKLPQHQKLPVNSQGVEQVHSRQRSGSAN
ncbi:hypothetical protein GP486_007104, partial [Trichoglossum hirsutum]